MRHYLTNEQMEARSRMIEISDNESFKIDRAYICLRDSIRLGNNPPQTVKYLGKTLANVHKARKELIAEHNYINTHHRRPE